MFKFSGCSRKLLYSEPKVTGVEISFAGESGENSTEKRTKIIVNFLDRKPPQFFRVLVEYNSLKGSVFQKPGIDCSILGQPKIQRKFPTSLF